MTLVARMLALRRTLIMKTKRWGEESGSVIQQCHVTQARELTMMVETMSFVMMAVVVAMIK